MRISFIPQLQDYNLNVYKVGDVLVVDGVTLDFNQLPEGGTLPFGSIQSKWVLGDVTRANGQIEITLTLPHGDNASEARRFPKPITMFNDGSVGFSL